MYLFDEGWDIEGQSRRMHRLDDLVRQVKPLCEAIRGKITQEILKEHEKCFKEAADALAELGATFNDGLFKPLLACGYPYPPPSTNISRQRMEDSMPAGYPKAT